MKKRYVLFLVLVLSSCVPDLETDTKFASEVKVVDSQGNPIEGAYVKISVETPSYDWDNDADINQIGTDANGDTFMLFSPPRGSVGFISVSAFVQNPVSENPVSNPYEFSSLTKIKKSQCVDYRLPVSQIALYRSEELVNLFIKAPENTGPNQFSIIDVTSDGKFSNAYPYNEFDIPFGFMLRAAKNQNITFHYKVFNNGQLTEHAETIEVGTEDIEHTLSI